jgi:hypothetical protein
MAARQAVLVPVRPSQRLVRLVVAERAVAVHEQVLGQQLHEQAAPVRARPVQRLAVRPPCRPGRKRQIMIALDLAVNPIITSLVRPDRFDSPCHICGLRRLEHQAPPANVIEHE